MSLAVSYTRANLGVDAPLVSVETHLSGGLPAFTIVGLPETAVKESRDRVRSAIINSHFEFPARRITVNLAPADLPKEGSRFDLAIAIGILAASGQVPKEALVDYEFVGELALSGSLRRVQGILPALLSSNGQRKIFLPTANLSESSLPVKCSTLLASHILEVCAHLNGGHLIEESPRPAAQFKHTLANDIADVRGQPQAKRALEIAAAGGHHLLMVGPPGTGKTMLANRLAGLLPPLAQQAAVDVATLHSLAGHTISLESWRQRPFRQPHHTASAVALVGGGSNPKPGEISLAHRGVLFLDELPEFDRKVLEVLREPLESGRITISRANQSVDFPARFQLVAAMNPCPCGYHGDLKRQCSCSAAQVQRYNNKVSGPLLDRIDLRVSVNRLPAHLLKEQTSAAGKTESSSLISRRILAAQKIQNNRQQALNALADPDIFTDPKFVTTEALDWLSNAAEKLALSARSFNRLLRVMRTLTDLEMAARGEKENQRVQVSHAKEALAFRFADKQS